MLSGDEMGYELTRVGKVEKQGGGENPEQKSNFISISRRNENTRKPDETNTSCAESESIILK